MYYTHLLICDIWYNVTDSVHGMREYTLDVSLGGSKGKEKYVPGGLTPATSPFFALCCLR